MASSVCPPARHRWGKETRDLQAAVCRRSVPDKAKGYQFSFTVRSLSPWAHSAKMADSFKSLKSSV